MAKPISMFQCCLVRTVIQRTEEAERTIEWASCDFVLGGQRRFAEELAK
jgi:hypothetical protein